MKSYQKIAVCSLIGLGSLGFFGFTKGVDGAFMNQYQQQSVLEQKIQEEAVAINVEVPVRVFKDNSFVDNLTLNDFELYEDGVLQKVEAIYLIKKKGVVRKEEKKKFIP